MSYSFILAPDSFKESLSAKDVCQAMALGIRQVFPDANIIHAPMADGGEGSTEAVVDATDGQLVSHIVQGPLGESVDGLIGLHGNGRSAFIEMASASGLHLVLSDQRNPLYTSTYGTGELIVECLEHGIRDIMIGLGGSATNDGGMGMAQALGYRFFNHDGKELNGNGVNLAQVDTIDTSNVHPKLSEVTFTVACDVDNILTGHEGASAVFGPQKGATPEMVEQLDQGLAHFASIIERDLGYSVADIPGSGAAGGLGAGLLAFTNAELKRGIDIIIETTELNKKLAQADFCFTGEGQMNHQTKYGKTPYGVMQLAKKLNPNMTVIAIAGSLSGDVNELYNLGFDGIFSSIPELMPLNTLMGDASRNVTRVTEAICRTLKSSQTHIR